MTADDSQQFGDLPGVEQTTAHGLPAVRVITDSASGLVFMQGAHVAAWQPATRAAVIWMSEKAVYARGKALRGGVPICFPWFGPNAEHPEYPQHGFARTRDFTYHGARRAADGGTELEFALESDARTRAVFPYAFSARLRVAFGATLNLEFAVRNRDAQPFGFEEALHSYFGVADVTRTAVLGLQGASYIDKVQSMARFTESAPELRLTGETDRVYESSATCTIHDPEADRAIRVEKANSKATVVWNPWSEKASQISDLGADSWPRMLCVESANVGSSRVRLTPGETHILRVTVSVEDLGSSASRSSA
jgi:glucose-6-phosphate 1-epimerase